MFTKRIVWPALACLVVLSLLLSACGGGAAPTQAPAAQPTQPPAAAPSTSGIGGDEAGARSKGLNALADAWAGKLKGKKVTMTGPFTDEDAVKFNNSMKEFKDKTGIDIQYEGSKEFEASISARIQAGDAPDVIDFPQPGLLAGFAKQGKIVETTKQANIGHTIRFVNMGSSPFDLDFAKLTQSRRSVH